VAALAATPLATASPPPGESAEAIEAAAAGEPESAAPIEEAPRGWVERAALTASVVDREPQGRVKQLTNDRDRIFYFTDVRGMQGETLIHRWELNGEVVIEVSLVIGGDRWRTYSTKQLDPSALGDWTVSAIDASGRVLSSDGFSYVEAPPEIEPPAKPAAASSAP
jgi:hypothetical protein